MHQHGEAKKKQKKEKKILQVGRGCWRCPWQEKMNREEEEGVMLLGNHWHWKNQEEMIIYPLIEEGEGAGLRE